MNYSPPGPGSNGVQPAIAHADLFPALLDELDTALMVCDGHGRLLFANFAARQELSRGAPLSLVDGHVMAGAEFALRARLGAAIRKQQRQLLVLGDAGSRVLALALPLAFRFGGNDCALLMLGRRRCRDLAIEMLASAFGFTGSEREVLAELADGKRANAIARSRQVALSTVRTQIQALRAKTRSDSIVAVLGLVSDMPPMTSALRDGRPAKQLFDVEPAFESERLREAA